MLFITGTFRVPPANLEAARPVMTATVEGSRAEAGCIHYSYGEDLLDPGLIHVTEHWTDRAALEAHWASPHIQGWRAAWPELGIGERDLTLFETDAGTPC